MWEALSGCHVSWEAQAETFLAVWTLCWGHHQCQNLRLRAGLKIQRTHLATHPGFLSADFDPYLYSNYYPFINRLFPFGSLPFWLHLLPLWWVLNQDTICMKGQKGESGRQKASWGWSPVGGRPVAHPLRRNGAALGDQEALRGGKNPQQLRRRRGPWEHNHLRHEEDTLLRRRAQSLSW